MLNRFRSFIVTYLGPTEDTGGRIVIRDPWHSRRIYIRYDHSLPQSAVDQAQMHLEHIGIKVVGTTNTLSDHYNTLLSDDFATPLHP